MEPLGQDPVGFWHLGDLGQHPAFAVGLGCAPAAAGFGLQLLGALLHRGPLGVAESLELLVARAGVLGRLLGVLHCRFLPNCSIERGGA
jgi:hypothetical protein